MPGELELYAYLNIEMAILLLQGFSFSAMSSRTLSLLSIVTESSMSGGFCHSVVGV